VESKGKEVALLTIYTFTFMVTWKYVGSNTALIPNHQWMVREREGGGK
jgi:hypothetical protein